MPLRAGPARLPGSPGLPARVVLPCSPAVAASSSLSVRCSRPCQKRGGWRACAPPPKKKPKNKSFSRFHAINGDKPRLAFAAGWRVRRGSCGELGCESCWSLSAFPPKSYRRLAVTGRGKNFIKPNINSKSLPELAYVY